MSTPVPLTKRPVDLLFVIFFVINLVFITYLFDVEQLTVDPVHFRYPLWPPRAIVDLAQWWGHAYDPALLARPPWWRATLWIDSLLFGPFYVAAIFAFTRGREWIRIPCFMWGSMMVTNVIVILAEEMWGQYATPARGMILFANGPWLLLPVAVMIRMALAEHPFSGERA